MGTFTPWVTSVYIAFNIDTSKRVTVAILNNEWMEIKFGKTPFLKP